MAIIGIQSLVYGVPEIASSRRFFEDFGLKTARVSESEVHFMLPEGSSLILRHVDDPALPASPMLGAGVREVVWGVDTRSALQSLVSDLSRDRRVDHDEDGSAHFLTDFGLPMALRVFEKKAVLCAPEPSNAPGHTVRLNQHRRWRQRARPKGIAHVVFAVPEFERGTAFMRERLGFKLSDEQVGFGNYLRADGTYNHHTFLLLNARAPLPGMDGKLRFHHANFAVEDLDEIMAGANHMDRRGWEPSHVGLGRHRIDSALFYYLPCPAGGEAEYGADSDCVDDDWVPRRWTEPLFAYAHWTHALPQFLRQPPRWTLDYLTDEVDVQPPHPAGH